MTIQKAKMAFMKMDGSLNSMFLLALVVKSKMTNLG